jgi:hypothetical protein
VNRAGNDVQRPHPSVPATYVVPQTGNVESHEVLVNKHIEDITKDEASTTTQTELFNTESIKRQNKELKRKGGEEKKVTDVTYSIHLTYLNLQLNKEANKEIDEPKKTTSKANRANRAIKITSSGQPYGAARYPYSKTTCIS